MRKFLTAAVGGMLLAGSIAGTAGAAAAHSDGRGDRDRGARPGTCSVDLEQDRRDLTVTVDGSRRANVAIARIDFDTRRGSTWLSVDLDRRGDGDASVRIPRRAESVDVAVFIREGRRGGFVRCDATLELDRRGGGRV